MATDWDKYNEQMMLIHKKVNEIIEERSKELVKKWIKILKVWKTGALYHSIETEVEKDVLNIIMNEYGIYQDMGTASIVARPFVQKAMQELGKQLPHIVLKEINK